MIHFYSVSKLPYLQKCTLNIKRGEFVVLFNDDSELIEVLGNLIKGEVKPDEGKIKILYNYEPGEKILKKELGIVYRENIFISHRSLRDNFNYISQIRGINWGLNCYRINKIAKLLEIDEYLDLYPDQLLAHQLIRANIAQALIVTPSILLLEKPLDSLDEVNLKGIFHLLDRINEEGVTVVMLSSSSDYLPVRKKKRRIVQLNNEEESSYYIR